MKRRSFLAASGAIAASSLLPTLGQAQTANPLVAPWTGPFGGVPPFDKVRVEDFSPAMDAAMAANRAEITAIAANPAPASFENTIVALERSGATLDRVGTYMGIWSGTLSTPAMQAVERDMAPKESAHSDAIIQNAALFARIQAVYDARETAGLTPEQQRLTWLYWNRFVRAGARLSAAAADGVCPETILPAGCLELERREEAAASAAAAAAKPGPSRAR